MEDSDKDNLNKFTHCNYYNAILFNKTNFSSDLFIIHYDLHSFSKNSDELSCILHQINPEINVLGLSETWFSPSYIEKIPEYVDYQSYRSNKKGEEELSI